MKRLFCGFFWFFLKTVSAAALECCKKILLIPEAVVCPWRERVGGRDCIFSKMYCFTEQSEAVFGFSL